MANEHLIYGIIGFFLGGILGGYLAGRTCAREYRKRIEELQETNTSLVSERRTEAQRGLIEREEAIQKAEHKVNKSLSAVKANLKADTKTFERLSREYRSDAFDQHFADRVAPDDSDDTSEEEDYRKISIIDEEQFKKDLNVRDCSTYTYYQEDGVLVDDTTQEVERDQAGILGEEGMEIIGDTEKDYLYIDNEPDDTLYEVVVEHSLSYYRDVCGL